jgi:polar amino acid transport system substrate-binding protein
MRSWRNGPRRSSGLSETFALILLVMLFGSGSPPTRAAELSSLLPANIREAEVITAAAIATYPPFAFVDDKNAPTGIEPELLHALAAKLHVKAQITPIEYPAMLPSIQAGRFEVGLGGFFDTPERRQVVLFVTNMYALGGLLTRKGNPDKIAFDNLCGKTVSTTEGTFQAIHLDLISKECVADGRPTVNIVLMKGTPPQVESLKSGRIAAIYLTKAVMAYMAGQNATDLEDLPGVMPDPSGEKKLQGFILPKSEKQLATALQEALNAAIADGTYARILKKWSIPEDVGVEKATVD